MAKKSKKGGSATTTAPAPVMEIRVVGGESVKIEPGKEFRVRLDGGCGVPSWCVDGTSVKTTIAAKSSGTVATVTVADDETGPLIITATTSSATATTEVDVAEPEKPGFFDDPKTFVENVKKDPAQLFLGGFKKKGMFIIASILFLIAGLIGRAFGASWSSDVITDVMTSYTMSTTPGMAEPYELFSSYKNGGGPNPFNEWEPWFTTLILFLALVVTLYVIGKIKEPMTGKKMALYSSYILFVTAVVFVWKNIATAAALGTSMLDIKIVLIPTAIVTVILIIILGKAMKKIMAKTKS
jgi:hypothetical protein